MLQTDDEWDNVLIEATTHLSTPAARDTMAYIIMYNNPNNLIQLFENHFESLSDDFMFIAQQNNLYISQEQRLIITIISTGKAIQKISVAPFLMINKLSRSDPE